jgi:glycosyltransferase involved in cell wall biosynthesis
MRIAYFTESLPPHTDGVSHTLSRLIQSLQNSAFDFMFFSPFKPREETSWSQKVRKVLSMPFPLYPQYRLSLPMFENLHKELDYFDPDLIHCISPTPLGIVGIDYAYKKRIPVVSSYHTHFVAYFRYYGLHPAERLGWNYLRWFYNRCQRTYVPSLSAMNLLNSQGINEVELWSRGIDTEKYSPNYRNQQLRKFLKADNRVILLFVGRLVREKDLDDLVAANDILTRRGHLFKLVIVGDGPMRAELAEKMPEAFFPGLMSGMQLAEYYASSDIFVFPSTTETFGNVVLEAFASGLPVVGVNKGGVSDLIDHSHTGFLAQANQPSDLADKIELLLADQTLRATMGQAARQFSLKRNWEAVNQKLFNSYENILSKFYSPN